MKWEIEVKEYDGVLKSEGKKTTNGRCLITHPKIYEHRMINSLFPGLQELY